VLFMAVRTNSHLFLVLPSRAFIAGAVCVCCAAVTESLTVAQVLVTVAVPWVMLNHRPFTAEARVQSQVSPCEN
jgi:hypothetical protein